MEKEDKIDKLARAVQMGFERVEERFERIDERLDRVENRMATKEDLASLRDDIDIMLDRHIRTFRKDYDELAARVKKIEEHIFGTRI